VHCRKPPLRHCGKPPSLRYRARSARAAPVLACACRRAARRLPRITESGHRMHRRQRLPPCRGDVLARGWTRPHDGSSRAARRAAALTRPCRSIGSLAPCRLRAVPLPSASLVTSHPRPLHASAPTLNRARTRWARLTGALSPLLACAFCCLPPSTCSTTHCCTAILSSPTHTPGSAAKRPQLAPWPASRGRRRLNACSQPRMPPSWVPRLQWQATNHALSPLVAWRERGALVTRPPPGRPPSPPGEMELCELTLPRPPALGG
jgi:hypothetical protein